MGIEYPPCKKQDHLGVLLRGAADNVLPLRLENALVHEAEYTHRCDEFFHVLSSALEETGGLQGDKSQHQEAKDALALLEKNAWLRTLAVKLSNLLGDLPRRE
jgi:hypothetical protein